MWVYEQENMTLLTTVAVAARINSTRTRDVICPVCDARALFSNLTLSFLSRKHLEVLKPKTACVVS